MKFLRIASLAVAVAMAAILAVRMIFGPFRFGLLSVTTPLNPEGLFGLAITILLLTRAGKGLMSSTPTRSSVALAGLGVGIIGVIGLHRSLGVYFLSDDFTLVKFGEEWNASALRYSITHGGGDGFFRPFGYIWFALNARIGGRDPMWWHAASLAIHSLNSVLVLLLARRLGVSLLAAAFTGSLFAVHGVHPEAVVWIAGRFDLMATFFLLAGLLLYTMAARERGLGYHAAALACFAFAVLNKESAYIFPLLAAAYAFTKRQALKSTVVYFALAAILFAYRWYLLGGIGGYIDRVTGRPAAVSLGLGSTLKAVAVRLWSSLYVPLNWSIEPSRPLAMLTIAYIAALLLLALQSRPSKPAFRLAAASLLVSVLPVLSLLAGSPTLAGARILYLPSVWFAMLVALALDGMTARVRYFVAAIILLFQFAALEHNLSFWETASARVKAACAAGAPDDVPDSIDGVPALANGKAECVEIARNRFGKP